MPAKFSTLLGKNFKVDWRSKWKILAEILIIVIVGLVATVRFDLVSKKLDKSELKNTIFYWHDTLDNLEQLKNLLRVSHGATRFSLSYSPKSQTTEEIMTSVKEQLKLRSVVGFANEHLLESHFDQRTFLAGVVFNSFKATTEKVPKHLNLTIRFPSIFRTIAPTPKDNVDIWKTRVHGVVESNIIEGDISANKDLYLREGFMQVHHQIFLQWYKRAVYEYNGDAKKYNVTTRNFRHTKRVSSRTLAIHYNYTDYVYYFAFLLPFLNMVWKFGREHEVDMGAQHQLLGFGLARYWLSHFIVSYVRLLPHCLILFLIIRIPWTTRQGTGIFLNTNPFCLMGFLLLYAFALVMCALFWGIIVQDAKNAVYLGLTVWLAFFGLFDMVLEQTNDEHIVYCVLAFVLFTNNAFPFGMAYLYDDSRDKQFYYIMGAMAGNILLNFVFFVYTLYKRPRRYMDPRPVLPLPRSGCCKPRKPDKKVAILGRTPSWQNFEGRLHMGEEYIILRNVCTHDPSNPDKEYLANVSLKAFKDEITAIVGPYSAGKTTILNIVTGWRDFPIGQVLVCKHDVQEEWHKVRPNLGVLMSHNHLFDLLTCGETLRYFVKMKLEKDDDEAVLTFEVNKWLEMLQPTVTRNMLVSKMTFEQKRLLSLCCIMCCHTKVILIDEPVVHMRAAEERQFFSILQREKSNRTIVFTTFSFHTAENSADRIGILVDGILKAYGTPFFLKDKFGYGFQLILMKHPKFPTEPITELLHEYMRNIAPDNEIGNQVVYLLPKNKRSKFQQILLHLEREKTNLGIADVRLVSTDLNEVYQSLDDKPHHQVISDYTKILKVTYLSEREIRHQQFRAMLYKKMLYPPPNIIPGIMILVSLFVIFFINHLGAVMEIPAAKYDGFQLGFPSSSTSRKLLAGFEECSFLHVKSWQVEWDEHQIGSVSRTFTKDSFLCSKKEFLEFAKENTDLHRWIGSLDLFHNKSAVVWVNQRIFHSSAMLLNLMHNRILGETFPDDPKVVTTLIHHPMPLPLSVRILLSGNTMTHTRVPLIVGIIAPITVSTFIFSVAEERRNHLLFLQTMAGLPMSIYWAVNLFWDALTFATYMIIYCVVMLFMTIEGFSISAKFTLLLLLSIYGIPALLMTYLISIFTYKSKLRSFLICCILQLMTGLGAFITYWDLLTFRVFYHVCSIFPSFAMLDGAINLYAASKEKEICWNRCDSIQGCTIQTMCHLIPQCCLDTFFKYESPGILHSMLLLGGSTLLLVFLLFWVSLQQNEQKFYQNEAVKANRSACYPYDDVNVVAIKRFIAAADWRVLRLKRFAVDQLENILPKDGRPLHTVSFIVEKYECLCILGSHHCGKTHLVRQLIGQDGFKFGDVYVNGMELKYELREAHNIMGYCPQDFGLVNSYSIRQLMYIICMMRGVLPLVIMELITEICQNLDLKRIMNRRIGRLTYDQRRKVNVAVSLLVYNKVLVLDEPTRGVSPHTRREIWNVLRYARFCGKTLIMTTNSVAECMQMADHLILYEDNEMLAAGTIHDLRFRYTKGFYLDIKLLRDGRTLEEADNNLHLDVENLKRFVSYLHEGAELIGRNDAILMFYLPVPIVSFSALFGSLEKNSRRLNIAEYSVSLGGMSDVLKTIHSRRVHKKIVVRRKK